MVDYFRDQLLIYITSADFYFNPFIEDCVREFDLPSSILQDCQVISCKLEGGDFALKLKQELIKKLFNAAKHQPNFNDYMQREIDYHKTKMYVFPVTIEELRKQTIAITCSKLGFNRFINYCEREYNLSRCGGDHQELIEKHFNELKDHSTFMRNTQNTITLIQLEQRVLHYIEDVDLFDKFNHFMELCNPYFTFPRSFYSDKHLLLMKNSNTERLRIMKRIVFTLFSRVHRCEEVKDNLLIGFVNRSFVRELQIFM